MRTKASIFRNDDAERQTEIYSNSEWRVEARKLEKRQRTLN